MLLVEDVHLSFARKGPLFRRVRKPVLKGVTFEMRRGECVGLIGASGSGKSTLGRVISGTARPESGVVRLMGRDVYGSRFARTGGSLRGKVSIVFQDYNTSVNPRFRVRDILREPLRGTRVAQGTLESLLEDVRLPAHYLDRLPHQLSGGELQRVCIARALAAKPPLILLDEAVSSLDVSVQFQVLQLLKTLKEEYGLSYLFISHDLTAVTYLCDRILFFNDGRVVEQVDDGCGLLHVKAPTSRRLLASVLT